MRKYKNHMARTWLVIFLTGFLVAGSSRAGAQNNKPVQSLADNWTFAIDPVRVGEAQDWYKKDFKSGSFDKVKVPHCFSVDPRYFFYTGAAWYFTTFNASRTGEEHLFLHFDAVFYKAKVWLNGELVATHEGGYTPFEIDVTSLVKEQNTLALQVDNSWDATTIPGSKNQVTFDAINSQQVYPWINYGGIIRPVYLVSRPALYIQNARIIADPDLNKGTAAISIRAFLKNQDSKTIERALQIIVLDENDRPCHRFASQKISVAAGEKRVLNVTATLPQKLVRLWHPDAPHLYKAVITLGSQTASYTFGIRKVEVKGVQLLLNGEPIKMGGCNRPLDYPGTGSTDPAGVLNTDMQLIKSGSMELSRISHYPVSTEMLDWTDRHGMLIIAEAGNWAMTPEQMSDTMMRRKYEQQATEMIERDWNHPSIIAYSMGNEFQSQTEQGRAWMRDMKAFTKKLDSTRLITFASMIVFRDNITSPGLEASQYADFVSANIYGDYPKNLDRIHKLYPDKPVYISEFGWRTDRVKNEEERVALLRAAVADFRKRDYVIGASVWTFNDYLSRYPGSAPNGYRPWGLVSPEREKRGMYLAWQEEFAPATIEVINRQAGSITLKITARNDFPSYTLKGYKLKSGTAIIDLGPLKPGESNELLVKTQGDTTVVQLIKPGGFTILEKTVR